MYFFFIMEHVPNGELEQYVMNKKSLSEVEIVKFFRQLIMAIKYIHSLHISHRDIKLQNILLDEYNDLKLLDFGLGNFYRVNEKLTTSCGTPSYASPELLVSNPSYDPEGVDVWACGVALYKLAFGVMPFEHKKEEIMFDKIRACKYNIPDHAPLGVVNMLSKIFVSDPKKRIKIKDIITDEWFLTCGLDGKKFDQTKIEPPIGKFGSLTFKTME